MWPLILQFIRINARYIVLPFAAFVGFVGFNLETMIRSPESISSKAHTPKQTISEARVQRQIEKDLTTGGDVSTASVRQYRRDPIFDKNK